MKLIDIVIFKYKQHKSWTSSTSHPLKTSTYQPKPRLECNLLRRNFLTCLKEKALRDEVPKMNCNVELVEK